MVIKSTDVFSSTFIYNGGTTKKQQQTEQRISIKTKQLKYK